MSSIEYPGRPADLPSDVSLAALVAGYHAHIGPLVDARHGIGTPSTAAMLAAHAIGALAYQHALADRALWTRWVSMRDALVYGATIEMVAAACALDPDEIAFGLRNWADGQYREGLMTSVEHAETIGLVSL